MDINYTRGDLDEALRHAGGEQMLDCRDKLKHDIKAYCSQFEGIKLGAGAGDICNLIDDHFEVFDINPVTKRRWIDGVELGEQQEHGLSGPSLPIGHLPGDEPVL
jgi:hypothetical protein